MLNILIKFAYPYVTLLMGAAYSIQQALEGAGIVSSNFLVRDAAGRIINSYWSPAEAMYLPFGALLLYCLILSFGFCAAGYALSRKKGVIIALLSLCVPGIVSVVGYWPKVNFMPEVYHIGGVGSLGSPYGMAALAIIALLSGWICTVIATDAWGLQDKFRHVYDHFWYSMAILAGLFFVADAGTSEEIRDLQDTTKHVQQASSYLLGQVREYAKYCKSASIEQKASCTWANDVQQYLVDYTVYDERLYWQLGPKSLDGLYSTFHRENSWLESVIRSELEQFNQLQCPTSKNRYAMPSGTCQRPPAEFCTGTEDGGNMGRTVAVSNECVVPTLVRLRSKMEKDVARVEGAARARHARWLFYLLVAVLAGGKVANATAKLTKVRFGETGLGDKRNVWRLVGATWAAIRFIGRLLGAILRCGYWQMKRAILWILRLPSVVSAKVTTHFKTVVTESDGS